MSSQFPILTLTWIFRYHLHEQEQQLENNGVGGGEVGEEKYCGIEKVVQVTFEVKTDDVLSAAQWTLETKEAKKHHT